MNRFMSFEEIARYVGLSKSDAVVRMFPILRDSAVFVGENDLRWRLSDVDAAIQRLDDRYRPIEPKETDKLDPLQLEDYLLRLEDEIGLLRFENHQRQRQVDELKQALEDAELDS